LRSTYIDEVGIPLRHDLSLHEQTDGDENGKSVSARQEKKPVTVLHSLHPSPTVPSTHHVGRLERLETSNKQQQKRQQRASKGMVKGCAKLGHVQPRAKVPRPNGRTFSIS